jgi:hypothetical protein
MFALVSWAEYDEYIHFMTVSVPHITRERAIQAFFREVGTTRIVSEGQLVDDPYYGTEDSPYRYIPIPEGAGYSIKYIMTPTRTIV